MNAQHVSEATMRVRDVVYAALLRWQGQTITEAFARSEANNLGVAIVEALAQLAEESKPPPVRYCPIHGPAPHRCNGINWGTPAEVQARAAEEHILAEIHRHGNGHHLHTPEAERHARALAYACPTCGAPPTYACSNDDPLAHHCPERQALVTETAYEHARRVIK